MLHRHVTWLNCRLSSRGVFRAILMIFFSLSIVSCANQVSSESASIPDVDIPAQNINTYIKLNDDPALENSHRNNENLYLQIVNLSKSNIIFPENFHAQVFKQVDGEWVKIGNNAFNTGDKFLLPPKEAGPLGLIVMLLPNTYITEPTTVRVSIDGFLEEDEQVRVGAFLDFQLKP